MAVLRSDSVIAALKKEVASGADRELLLRRCAELVRAEGEPYTSVYLYMLHGDTLVLEGYSGRATEHVRIPVGQGVCGTAVASGEDQNVGDVHARENYLACNLHTRSELVVLIRDGMNILGQIDIDSDQLDPFTPAEVIELRAVAAAMAKWLK